MKPLRGLDPNHIPIFPRKGYFKVGIKGQNQGKKTYKEVRVNRTHFPIVPRFSCTSHKSQGMTLNKAIVDLVRPANYKGAINTSFAYVPLSRVRRLDDLTILRPFDASVINVQPNPACAAMMEEFKNMDKCKMFKY